jgi:hypothetical protein
MVSARRSARYSVEGGEGVGRGYHSERQFQQRFTQPCVLTASSRGSRTMAIAVGAWPPTELRTKASNASERVCL